MDNKDRPLIYKIKDFVKKHYYKGVAIGIVGILLLLIVSFFKISYPSIWFTILVPISFILILTALVLIFTKIIFDIIESFINADIIGGIILVAILVLMLWKFF